MFSLCLSLFSLGLDSSSRGEARKGPERSARAVPRIASLFFLGNASFHASQKKKHISKFFYFVWRERKNTHRHASSAARATTTRTTITNARYARARDLFSLPRSLYLFLFVVAYLILISLATVVELTRSVVRLSAFAYELIA